MQRKKTAMKKLLSSAFNIGKIIIIVLFVCYSKKTDAQENGKSQFKTFQNVEIPGTQVREIYSSIVEQEYKLHINLPRNYNDTTKIFPVVYLLDSQWDFPLVEAIYGEQYYDGFLPELIIVGITWGGENPNHDQLRFRDFTPTDIKSNQPSGNARNFIKFIEKELIPFMGTNYRASKSDKTLMGSSLGGLFTIYVLFNHTGIFNRYILTSPAIFWDNGITYTYEKEYAEENSELHAKVFMGIGELEKGWVPGFEKLVSQIKDRNYKGLELKTKIIEGIGHSGGKADGYTRGLQFIFAKPAIKVDASVLKQYAGEYKLDQQQKIKLVIENGSLCAIQPYGTKIILHAETENNFYVKGEYLFLHFKRDENNKVAGFLLQSYGGESFVKKISE